MIMKKILAIITILTLIFLAGCGEDKECPASCDDGNPCTTDTCSKETGYECRHTPIPGCTLECGVPCTGSAGAYMTMQCDPETKQCESAIKPGIEVETSSLTNEMLSMGNKFKIITTFVQPFNMNKDLFNIELSASQFGAGISDIKIKKVELSGTDSNRQTITLGEEIVNKYIWTTETTVEEDLRIDFATSADDLELSNIKLRVTYDYDQEFGGEITSKTAAFEITLRGVSFIIINPTITQTCPAECNDNNPGTADVCSAETDYFCEHQPLPGKCGNFLCEPDENKCSCPEDCGPCTGEAGKYLTFICQENECRTMIKQGTIQEPISKIDDKNRNFYYLQNKYSFKNPFNVNTDKFVLEFSLYNKQDAVGTVTIKDVKILDQSTEVASASVGKTLAGLGSTATVEVPVETFALYEEEKSLRIRVDTEYQFTTSSGTELRKDSFTTPLERVTLIKPTVK